MLIDQQNFVQHRCSIRITTSMSEQRSLEQILGTLCGQRAKLDLSDRFSAFGHWREMFLNLRARWEPPIDQAIAGGFESDRIGYAFAAGYQSALLQMFSGIKNDELASICISEEGGAHPRAINTRYNDDGQGGGVLDGQKKWSTMAPVAQTLFIAAVRVTAQDDPANGAASKTVAQDKPRKNIVMLRVAKTAAGLHVKSMPETPFTPEIMHGLTSIDGVRTKSSDLLDGDGYSRYIKPFRSIEDTFVTAACAAFMLRIGLASAWPPAVVGDLLQLLTVLRTISAADPLDPSVQLVLDSASRSMARLASTEQPQWQLVGEPQRSRWERDLPIFSVASSARAARLDSAWQRATGR